MKMSVLICTLGRPEVLHGTVESVLAQTHPAHEILIGTPSTENVLPATLRLPGVRLILTTLGLTRQRNACLDRLAPDAELVVFFDDDTELAPDFLACMAALFRENPALVASSGRLLYDGGIDLVCDRAQARVKCLEAPPSWSPDKPVRTEPLRSTYGCDMVFRADRVRSVRFDENLPLYAWLEDADFSHAVTSGHMAALTNRDAMAVHLGARGGRIDGLRLGFSQMVNPIYLWRKSRVFTLPYLLIHFWLRCLVGNVLGLFTGEPQEDRVGRLAGNAAGLLHLLRGRCRPQDIMLLPAGPLFGPWESEPGEDAGLARPGEKSALGSRLESGRAPKTASGKSKEIFRGLNGLRFFAAIAVVCFHYAGRVSGFATAPLAVRNLVGCGPIALPFFFLLSGFVLSHAYADRLPSGPGGRGRFWMARFARLYPVYLLAFVLFAPVAYEKYVRLHAGGGIRTAVWGGALSLFTLQAWTPLSQAWNGPGWSLSVEAFFYAIFPFAGRWFLTAPAARVWPALGAFWCAMVAIPLAHEHGSLSTSLWITWIENNPLFWTPAFFGGIVLYRVYPLFARRAPGVATLAALAGSALLLLLCGAAGPPMQELLISGGTIPLLALLVLAFAHPSALPGRLLGTAFLFELGSVSYAVYILQSPLWQMYQTVAARLTGRAGVPAPEFALFLALLTIAALLVREWVERPAQRRLLAMWTWSDARTPAPSQKQPVHAIEPPVTSRAGGMS